MSRINLDDVKLKHPEWSEARCLKAINREFDRRERRAILRRLKRERDGLSLAKILFDELFWNCPYSKDIALRPRHTP